MHGSHILANVGGAGGGVHQHGCRDIRLRLNLQGDTKVKLTLQVAR